VNGHDISRHVGASSQTKAKVADRNEEHVDASVEDLNASAGDMDASVMDASVGDTDATHAPIELRPASEEPVFDVGRHIARLEASTGAALALLRRCIVEDTSPTREALAAEAEFAFGMPSEAALAEIDQIAEMVGISSLR
jgi:hypothetical protein